MPFLQSLAQDHRQYSLTEPPLGENVEVMGTDPGTRRDWIGSDLAV
jgi:hypothetical protein